MNKQVRYRFERFIYPVRVSRTEVEKGSANWGFIRRRSLQLADERNEEILLYVYNDALRRWEYSGKALPGGYLYDSNGGGPYFRDERGVRFHKKGGAL